MMKPESTPQATAFSAKRVRFLPRLESLRGIAAVSVVGYHMHDELSLLAPIDGLDRFANKLFAAIANGTGAVVTFFVLSGFVLARSLEANPNPLRFVRNRAFRLYPAAIAVVLLLTFLHWRFGLYVGYEASFDPLQVVLNLMMIRTEINGVMWSMTVECVATPLIWLSVWLYCKHGERPLWWIIAVLVGLSFWGPYVHMLGGFTNLGPFYAFVVGVMIHFKGAGVAARLGERFAKPAAISAIVLYCIGGANKQTGWILALECASAAMLIVLIAWREHEALFRPLDWKLVRFYGRISYSFYLLHPLGMLTAERTLNAQALYNAGMPVSATLALMTLLAVLLTTPAAWLTWRLVEMPAIRLGRTLDKPSAVLAAR
jgi:peptidoglycan/LPS O-acetylase OafA/YrhL